MAAVCLASAVTNRSRAVLRAHTRRVSLVASTCISACGRRGCPLRPHTRSGGVPNCAPSLRSVAGLLGRSLDAACEDHLTSLHRSVTAVALRATGVCTSCFMVGASSPLLTGEPSVARRAPALAEKGLRDRLGLAHEGTTEAI